MFLIVFKALFTEFRNCACAKKCYAYKNSPYLCCIITQEIVLSLETSSEINFEFIKVVKKGKCLPLTNTNREYYINITFPDWVIVKSIIPRNVIITFPEMIFPTITQSENVIFILLYRILDPLFSTILGLPWWVLKRKWCTASYLYAWMKKHLSQKWFL